MSTTNANSRRPFSLRNLDPSAERVVSADERREHDRLLQVQRLARWMDSSFRIPGTPIQFGWDSLIGFIPGVGDVATAAIGGWIIREAQRAGASKLTVAKMFGNVAVDMSVGVIPLLGDLFDVYWKSNARNAKLLEKHLSERSTAADSD